MIKTSTNNLLNYIIIAFLCLISIDSRAFKTQKVVCGADQPEEYLSILKGKKVGLVVNQTSRIGKAYLVDYLKKKGIDVKLIFAPEHGFRGDNEAGAEIKNGVDQKTKIPIKSLYGDTKKPSKEDIQSLDILLFDIQDVGCRFYTYISTLHYVMEACAENKKPLLILDRPNPNGFYVDGPILKREFSSFVGMHPVPIVHGLTIAEYAQMINGEHWLKDSVVCELKIVKVKGYSHDFKYILPVPPSPNLNTMEAVYLYPTLCLFEGTPVSIGRGTENPFTLIGMPGFKKGNYCFTPKPIKGKSENPPQNGKECCGYDLKHFANDFIVNSRQIYLFWLTGFYNESDDKSKFFTSFFDKLAGSDQLRLKIIEGKSDKQIRDSWQTDLKEFKIKRIKYLLYGEFSGLE